MSQEKRRRVDTSNDPDVWMQWLDEMRSSDESETENDSSSEDEIDDPEVDVESDHDSSSLQDASDSSENSDHEDEPEERNKYFIGKDKTTKWRKETPNIHIRTRAHNIITHLPGSKGIARNAKSGIECLNILLDEAIVETITRCTNIYIENIKERFERERDARNTDEREIKAFIGILYLIGVLRSSRKNLHKIWDNSKGSGVEICYLAMSEKRFRFLLRCLRFDDIRNRSERRKIDKMAPIREIFERFLANFQRYFIASEYLTVDEQLLAFRGRCSFKQYIPSKPARYGIKVFALVDVKSGYTFNLEAYVGTQPEGPYKFNNSGEEIVLRLVEPVAYTNRNITADNWFTSVKLVKKLLDDKKLTYVGTVRKNKAELPKEFLPDKNKEIKSSIFGFQKECTIVSYCPKKNKSVILISSMHHDNAIDVETGDAKKPEIITMYNQTKFAVDRLDQLCEKYNVSRNTRRYPMVIFYDLLNITAINSLCLYKSNNWNKKVARSDFIEQLAWELIRPQIEFRSTIMQVSPELRRRARVLLGISEVATPHPPVNPNSVRRCSFCDRKRDRSTRRCCKKCQRYACKEHLSEICVECMQLI